MTIEQDERAKLVLEQASDIRKFEIELFWRRSLFFWGFLSAAFVAYGALLTRSSHQTMPASQSDTDIIFVISCFGVICSLAWTLVNRGSKYWQEVWEQKLENVQEEVLGQDLFSRKEPTKGTSWWGARRYSVSKLAIALSDFVVLVWLCLAYKANPFANDHSTFLSFIALAVTLFYACAMLWWGRSTSKQ
jgi:hypothetical protein